MSKTCEHFQANLASGVTAKVVRIDAQSLDVLPLFLQSASAAENALAAQLGMARHHAHSDQTTPEHLLHGMHALPTADKTLDTPEDIVHPLLGRLRLYSQRAKMCALQTSHVMVPLHMLRLATADLQPAELLLNACHFLFLPQEFTCLWNAYGDPIGLVVANGVVQAPPQLPRSCLLAAGSAFSIQNLSFADVSVQLSNGECLSAHPAGSPLASSEHRAYSLFYGSVQGATPVAASAYDVAYIGRYALAMKSGGGMPIPTAGCVLRFDSEQAADQAAQSGPVTYQLPTTIDSAVQAGPLLVRDGRNTRLDSTNVLHLEAMSPATNLPDNAVLSPFGWKADWDTTRAARLAAGITDTGALFFCVVEGSSSFLKVAAIKGATLHDLSELMLEQGAQRAIHLDGGGSTQVFGTAGGALVQCGDVLHGLEERPAQYDRPIPLALKIA